MSELFISNRDHLFICGEWLNLEPVFWAERYKNWSVDNLKTSLDLMLKVAKKIIAPTNKDADTIGVQFKDGKVTVPPSLHSAYWYLQENGLGSSNEYEQTEDPLPATLQNVFLEYASGANPSLMPYVGLTTGAANLIQRFGSESDKKAFLQKMYSGKWAGTICMTEPGSGSDAGDASARAYPTTDPKVYKIIGSKCFISSGDHDITENIIHLVLARVDGAAKGAKGLSLFIVPKFWVTPNGTLGGLNSIATLGIEHKMGLKGSATASLAFDESLGILLGNAPTVAGVGEGMMQMFQMTNSGRIKTGIMAIGVAAAAYAAAVHYAKERVQGRPFTDQRSHRVPIIKHEDIRRMLLNSKALLEGMRAMAYKTAYLFDLSRVAPTIEERACALRSLEINTPLIKAYCSDVAWQIVSDAIQVHGGYGYSEEFPVAQFARDVKVYSIWEGTNFIQSLDLVGRKFNMEKGRIFEDWMNSIREGIDSYSVKPELAKESAVLGKAWTEVKKVYLWIEEQASGGNRALIPLYSTRVLHCCAMLVCGQLLLDQAALALNRLSQLGEEHPDYTFYKGKIGTARHFARNIVPNISSLAKIIMSADTSSIDIPEEAF